MTEEHNRRPGYWRYYELAEKTMDSFMDASLLDLLRDHPHPARRTSALGTKPTHSEEKLDFACLDMTSENDPYRSASRGLQRMRHVWDEPVPTHKTLVEHMQTVDTDWLDFMVAKTAFLCLKELAICGATAPLGADSSGIETARYEYAEAPETTLDDFLPADEERPRRKEYLKYHITAVLGHQVILTAITTPGSVHDSKMLPVMLKKLKRFGFDFSGRYFNADRGYDSDENSREIFESGMLPNIRQREYRSRRGAPPPNPAKTYRELAAGMFNPAEYKQRSFIEAIFGAEEVNRHQLHCRFLLEENKNRFSKFRAIAWNLRALHRFRCANELGIPIPSYGVSRDDKCTDNQDLLAPSIPIN